MGEKPNLSYLPIPWERSDIGPVDWEQLIEPELSEEEKRLVEEYKKGVKVFIFNYQGYLQSHLRFRIDTFGEHWCKGHGIEYEECRVKHRYFSDIRDCVFLRDEYGRKIIKGLHQITDYILLLDNSFYQKHNIVPEMRKKLEK